MIKHKVVVKQVFRVTRLMALEVEAGSPAEAVELQTEREAPDYADPRWSESRELLREEVHADRPLPRR